MRKELEIPLMSNNISMDDLEVLISFLKTNPKLTQASNVIEFEREWSKWLGVKYSVFVNSGSSANVLTMAAIKHLYGQGEIIVPTLTWSSDISSIMHTGLTPVFVDVNPRNLAMADDQIIKKITSNTKAVFLTHILGFNGLTQRLLDELNHRKILLIEDVCESHGATFKGKRLGSYGFASNFSYYFAHHMSTIEGGMVCTNDEEFYEVTRMLRSHGMTREISSEKIKKRWIDEHPDLNPEFIFSYPGYNMRSTEINAVIGRHQLKKLDENNLRRVENCKLFYSRLDSKKYWTDFDFEGQVNYAFVLILKEKDPNLMEKINKALTDAKVEYRRGTSGGGNQLRQPFVKSVYGKQYRLEDFPIVDHVHFFGRYIGNYPTLEKEKIIALTDLLNSI